MVSYLLIRKCMFFVLSLPLFSLMGIHMILVICRFRRRKGVSRTAYMVHQYRWFAHAIGVRQDKVAYDLMFLFPFTISIVLHTIVKMCNFFFWLLRIKPTPMLGTEGWGAIEYLPARTRFIDACIKNMAADDELDQFVMLGAGFDTRAYGSNMLNLSNSTKIFEVDTVDTQNYKKMLLSKANVDFSHVKFVTVNFNKDSWLECLEENGFDPSKNSLFLWEGVTYYLEPKSVVTFLGEVSKCLQQSPKSRLVFDYMLQTQEGVKDASIRQLVKSVGEPFRYKIKNNVYEFMKTFDHVKVINNVTFTDGKAGVAYIGKK